MQTSEGWARLRTVKKDIHPLFWEGGATMELDAITSLFSNLAVPVACLIATFYLWNKEREDHKQEQKELTEAIANNTLVMQKLVDKLDRGGAND